MKSLILGLLLLPSLSLGATFSIAITNDSKATTYLTGKPGYWKFTAGTRITDSTINCDGVACPEAIQDNQTIVFTVITPRGTQFPGFDVEFESQPFLIGQNLCTRKESYWIYGNVNQTAMIISDAPPNGGIHKQSTECVPTSMPEQA